MSGRHAAPAQADRPHVAQLEDSADPFPVCALCGALPWSERHS